MIMYFRFTRVFIEANVALTLILILMHKNGLCNQYEYIAYFRNNLMQIFTTLGSDTGGQPLGVGGSVTLGSLA